MNVRHTAADVGLKSLNLAHRVILKVSGGRLMRNPLGMRTVELHTTGRKSGQRRSNLLTAPIYDDDRIVLVASKGGDERNPDWYHNLAVNPDVEVTVDGVTRPMRARTASPDEKAELWPQITAAYKGYASYQRRTSRDIPVLICEPRAG